MLLVVTVTLGKCKTSEKTLRKNVSVLHHVKPFLVSHCWPSVHLLLILLTAKQLKLINNLPLVNILEV